MGTSIKLEDRLERHQFFRSWRSDLILIQGDSRRQQYLILYEEYYFGTYLMISENQPTWRSWSKPREFFMDVMNIWFGHFKGDSWFLDQLITTRNPSMFCFKSRIYLSTWFINIDGLQVTSKDVVQLPTC